MTFLFKYTNKKYGDKLIKNGEFRIGTLYDFRKNDKYGDIIGDPHEGIQKETLKTDEPKEIDVHSNTAEASFFMRNYPSLKEKKLINGAKIIIKTSGGTSFEQATSSQDLFLFCMSSTFNKEAMKEFGCDVCIKIDYPEKFFSAISHTMRHKATFAGMWNVEYKSRTTDYLNPHSTHPALIKDLKHKNQSEVRVVWEPKKKGIKPINIVCRRAKKYCSIYYVLE